MSRVLGWVCYVWAAFAALLPTFFLLQSVKQQLLWQPAEAVVTRVLHDCYVDVCFTTQAGQQQETFLHYEALMCHRHQVGDRLRVLYSAAAPQHAVEDSFRVLYGDGLLLELGPLFLACIGRGFLRRANRKSQRTHNA